jgi:hypothetical protein
MIDVTIMWSNAVDATFDHDYYLQKHIPMLGELLGDKLKKVEVASGIGGLEPGAPPPYVAITGSSDLSMGWSISVRPSAVGGEHDSESVVIKIFEAVGQSADLFDDQVDGFGAAVGDT